MDAAQGQAAVAQGSLADTPVTNLLLYLYRKGSAGSLILEAADGRQATILFHGGRPCAARFSDGSNTNLPNGLLVLCGLRDGRYSFYEADLIGDDESAVRGAIDPYTLLMAALRDHPRDDLVEATLARYEGTAMRLQPRCEISRLQLRPDEQAVVDVLRAEPLDPPTLIAQAPLPNRRAARVMYALLVTHMAAPHQAETDTGSSHVRRVSTGPTPVSKPPVQPPAQGAAQSPTPAKRARPASSPEGTAAPKPQGSITINNLPAASPAPGALPAWQRLASLRPNTGGAPSRPRPGTDSFLPPDASPEMRLEKAARLISRGRAPDARVLVDLVLKSDPENPDALALKAHTMFALTRNRSRGLPKEIMETVRRCLRTEPEHARGLLVKGLIYKEAGEYRKALSCFKRSVAEEPSCLEAQRELRLAKMRQG